MVLAPGLARAESGVELLEKSAGFDGKQVTFQGEVIGVMVRGDHAWVNISDKGFAAGIWCRAEDARKISIVGDYNHIGDYVSVVGIFHKACVEHGGDLDVHADSFTILISGSKVERAPSLPLIGLGLALMVMAAVAGVWLRRRRAEKKRQHYLFEG